MAFKLCVVVTVFMVLTVNAEVVEETPGDNAITPKYMQSIPEENSNIAEDEESSDPVVGTRSRLYRAIKAKITSRKPSDKNIVKVKALGKPSTAQVAGGKKPGNKTVKSTGDVSVRSLEKESSERVTGNKPSKTKYTAESPADDVSNNAAGEETQELIIAVKQVDRNAQGKYEIQTPAEESAGDISGKDAEKITSERVAAKKPADKAAKFSKYTDAYEGSAEDISKATEEKPTGQVAAKKPANKPVKSKYTVKSPAGDVRSNGTESDTTEKVDSKKAASKIKIVKSNNSSENSAGGDISLKLSGKESTGQIVPATKEPVNKTKTVKSKSKAENPAGDVSSKVAGDVSSKVAGDVSSKTAEEEPKIEFVFIAAKKPVYKVVNGKYTSERPTEYSSSYDAGSSSGQSVAKKPKNPYADGDDVGSKSGYLDYVEVGNKAGMEDNFSAYDAAVMDFSSNEDSKDDEDDDKPQVKDCRSKYKDCKRYSPLISDYLVCFASFAPCVSENSKVCQNKCGPNLISCMRKVKLNSWRQHSECASKYIDCSREKCT